MAERERLGAAPHLVHERRRRRLVEGAQHGVLARLRRPSPGGARRTAADHRGASQDAARRLGEPSEPPADHLAHTLGNAEAPRRRPVRPAPALAGRARPTRSGAGHLADEERIPLRLPPDDVRERDPAHRRGRGAPRRPPGPRPPRHRARAAPARSTPLSRRRSASTAVSGCCARDRCRGTCR